MTGSDYVLLTPARNEAQFIGRTIAAVATQTIRPKKWVIISDGSTDGTDEIVRSFAEEHKFICFLRTSSNGKRSFGAKVNAIRAGYEQLRNISFDYLGNLDADVTFEADYYENVLQRFRDDSRLGVGGGIIHELLNGKFVTQRTSSNSVAGAVQLFRRRCYEEIGGYVALRFGGIDSAAEITARMYGWGVRTFRDLIVQHHRPVGSGGGSLLKTKFRQGKSYHSLGYHPLFELVRCIYRLGDKPYFVGSLLMTCGYWWSLLTRQEKELPEQVVRYLRSEQTEKLRCLCFGRRLD
jgi:biofilm PGA synthesis N-glycosyltransferase PgaC